MARMNTFNTKLPLESFHWMCVEKFSSFVVVVVVAVVCTVFVFLFTNVQLLCTERDAIYLFFSIHKSNRNGWALSLIKIPIIPQIQHFLFLLLVIVWLILLLQNGYFIFICVQSSLRQFYSLVAKLHFDSVTVEKWAMNARHLFECEFHWQSFFFALVCSLLFSQSTESGWRRREEEKMTGKYHFWW